MPDPGSSSLTDVLRSLPTGLLMEDSRRRILQVNGAFLSMFSIPATADQLIGTDCSRSAEQVKPLFAKPDEFERIVTDLVNRKELATGQRFPLKDGRVFECDYFPIHQEDGTTGHLWQYRDVSERYRLAEELERREGLLLSVAEVAASLLSVEGRPDVNLSLQILGEAANVDRVYIFENHPLPGTGEAGLSQRYEWTNGNTSPQADNPEMQNIPWHPNFTRWHTVLSRRQAVHGLVAEFPESERPVLEMQDIKSLLVVPILVRGYFWGFIGLDDCQRNRRWSESDRSVLLAGAGLLGASLERERAAAALRESEERLSLALDGAELGVWDWNVKTGDVFFSRRWVEMLGHDPLTVEPHFRTWDRLLHPEDRKAVEKNLQDHFDGRTPLYVCEHRLKTRNGTWKWILAQGKVVEFDDDGAPLRMTGTHTDISERKAVEEMKSDFVAMVSHQLKTPLAQICGFIDNMMDGFAGPVTPKQREYLTFMHDTGQRGFGLISDLLSVSTLERGIMTAEIESTSISQILEDALTHHGKRLAERGLTLTIENHAGRNARVNADPAKSVEALSNVIGNAVSYTQKGGIVIRIEAGENVVVRVSDTGPGIPQERLTTIFDKQRVLAGSPSAESGAGLGLHIAYQLMKLQGGRLCVASAVGHGTTFQFTFPRAADGREEVDHVRSKAA